MAGLLSTSASACNCHFPMLPYSCYPRSCFNSYSVVQKMKKMPSFSTVRASSDKLETPPITVEDEVGESLQIGDIEESPDEGPQSKSSSFSASTGASPLIAKELKKASFCLLVSMMPKLLKSVLGELHFCLELVHMYGNMFG